MVDHSKWYMKATRASAFMHIYVTFCALISRSTISMPVELYGSEGGLCVLVPKVRTNDE